VTKKLQNKCIADERQCSTGRKLPLNHIAHAIQARNCLFFAIVATGCAKNCQKIHGLRLSILTVSKISGASSSLPNSTIIGATNQNPTKVILIKAFLLVKTLVFSFSCRRTRTFIDLHQTLKADRGRQCNFCHRQLLLDPIPSFCTRVQNTFLGFLVQKFFL